MSKISTVSDVIHFLSKFPGELPVLVASKDGVYCIGGAIFGGFYIEDNPTIALKFVRGDVEADYDPENSLGVGYEFNKSLDVESLPICIPN